MPSNQLPEDVRERAERVVAKQMCSQTPTCKEHRDDAREVVSAIAPLIIEWARKDQAENPKCEHGIALSDLCEYANHRANDLRDEPPERRPVEAPASYCTGCSRYGWHADDCTVGRPTPETTGGTTNG